MIGRVRKRRRTDENKKTGVHVLNVHNKDRVVGSLGVLHKCTSMRGNAMMMMMMIVISSIVGSDNN